MLKKYVWVVEWIATALLIVLGIIAVVEKTILLYTFGILFIILGLFRIIPLLKTTSSKLVKWLLFGETLLDILSGGVLLFLAIKNSETGNYVGYIIGGVLYLRGFIHFLSTSLKDEPSNLVNFFFHIVLLTIGTIVITKGGFDKVLLAWLFLIVIAICALILAIKGYRDYSNYRNNLSCESKLKKLEGEVSKDKSKKDKKIDDVEAPTSEEIKINIIPDDDKPSVGA